MSNYISQKEMANQLNKSVNTIRHWVEKGLITPVNPDTYRSDGGYRFTDEEYQKLKKKWFDQDTLFVVDAAKLIGVSKQYLGVLAKSDQIPSQMIMYGSQLRRVFKRSDCLALKESLDNSSSSPLSRDSGRELNLYKNNLRLFDSFTLHNQKVVVLSVDPIRLMDQNMNIIEPSGYLPTSKPCLDLPYERKTGRILFNFPRESDVNSKIYSLLTTMIEFMGTKNIRVFERENHYFVTCRIGRFKGSNSDYKLLEQYLVEGNIHFNGEYIELEGSLVAKRTNYTKAIYERITELTHQTGNTFDQTVNLLLAKALEKEPLED
ncbi:MerR family transcriptional regulator [Cohnella sp. AR92]|uniref:MerR family transcriptional regulator n=1 Tax=Cohnella sp. AR92 TaxID=648716 RepID=UPI000F8F430D|nr:MerR family transcriptional regulator [Cohnella sp. AR92]RUS45001.1 MerR family transcriptional regulator [Cohnella sp. AR92]